MKLRVLAGLSVLVLISSLAVAAEPADATAEVVIVLDSLHQAASDADGKLYFSLFGEDAIYMGTDASERWTVEEFQAYAEPHFSQGRGWTYVAKERHVYVAIDGATAWFDEILWNDSYGTCRGTGVLVLVDGNWRISQYHLTFPIPNDLAKDFTAQIKEFESAKDR
ncbi:MAG: nuclear transport factor 2 family protein [bacterium]|nr:nuclear transport factor 2 family protein [bacterium]